MTGEDKEDKEDKEDELIKVHEKDRSEAEKAARQKQAKQERKQAERGADWTPDDKLKVAIRTKPKPKSAPEEYDWRHDPHYDGFVEKKDFIPLMPASSDGSKSTKASKEEEVSQRFIDEMTGEFVWKDRSVLADGGFDNFKLAYCAYKAAPQGTTYLDIEKIYAVAQATLRFRDQGAKEVVQEKPKAEKRSFVETALASESAQKSAPNSAAQKSQKNRWTIVPVPSKLVTDERVFAVFVTENDNAAAEALKWLKGMPSGNEVEYFEYVEKALFLYDLPLKGF